MEENPYFDPEIAYREPSKMEREIQEEILSLYEKKGLEQISVAEACKDLGIARTTFYYHYASPREALDHAENNFLAKLKEISDDVVPSFEKKDPVYEVSRDATVEFLLKNKPLLMVCLVQRSDPVFVSRWTKNFCHNFYSYAKGDELKLLTTASTCLTYYRYIISRDEVPSVEMQNHLVELIKFILA